MQPPHVLNGMASLISEKPEADMWQIPPLVLVLRLAYPVQLLYIKTLERCITAVHCTAQREGRRRSVVGDTADHLVGRDAGAGRLVSERL